MWFDGMFNIFLWGGVDGNVKKKNVSKFKNNFAFRMTFSRLLGDALERYDFEGLPDTVSKRVLKQALLWYGSACFFEKDGSVLCLPCCPNGGQFNIYGDPGRVWVFGRNGQMNEGVKVFIPGSDESSFLFKGQGGMNMSSDTKGVIIWENKVRIPFFDAVMFYSSAIADSMRTLDTARANIKTPYVVVAEESVVPTVQEFFKKRDNNEDVVISSGVFPVDRVNILPIVTDTGILQNATQLVEWYEQKYRELCGFQSNSQQDKKGENLVRDEIHINDEYEALQVSKCMEQIQENLDQANRIFGLNMKVVKNSVVRENDELKQNMESEVEGDERNDDV